MGLFACFSCPLRRLCEALLANVTEFYSSYDTVPQEADDNVDALAEAHDAFLQDPGVADGEEDAPQERPSDREDAISSSEEDESSGTRSPPPVFDCLDVGCTWPCVHHVHWDKDLNFFWYPDLEFWDRHSPQMPRVQQEMKIGVKDCQFCRIFFGIAQSDCDCRANAHDDHIRKSGGCHCEHAVFLIQSNGQLANVSMFWTCSRASYELGWATGKVVWSL